MKACESWRESRCLFWLPGAGAGAAPSSRFVCETLYSTRHTRNVQRLCTHTTRNGTEWYIHQVCGVVGGETPRADTRRREEGTGETHYLPSRPSPSPTRAVAVLVQHRTRRRAPPRDARSSTQSRRASSRGRAPPPDGARSGRGGSLFALCPTAVRRYHRSLRHSLIFLFRLFATLYRRLHQIVHPLAQPLLLA
jgi:hypothetical protein